MGRARIGAFVRGASRHDTCVTGRSTGLARRHLRPWEVYPHHARWARGETSVKNLGGPLASPISLAKSAELRVVLSSDVPALIGVSLGVLNLLPLPVLDGGTTMHYLWEVTGERLGSGWSGAAARRCLASRHDVIAMFADVTRHMRKFHLTPAPRAEAHATSMNKSIVAAFHQMVRDRAGCCFHGLGGRSVHGQNVSKASGA